MCDPQKTEPSRDFTFPSSTKLSKPVCVSLHISHQTRNSSSVQQPHVAVALLEQISLQPFSSHISKMVKMQNILYVFFGGEYFYFLIEFIGKQPIAASFSHQCFPLPHPAPVPSSLSLNINWKNTIWRGLKKNKKPKKQTKEKETLQSFELRLRQQSQVPASCWPSATWSHGIPPGTSRWASHTNTFPPCERGLSHHIPRIQWERVPLVNKLLFYSHFRPDFTLDLEIL